MRKKRKTKYTWLPVIGQANITDNDPDTAGFGTINLVGAGATGAEDLTVTPLILDEPQETVAGNLAGGENTLADIIGSEYFIKRIVGKFFCSYSQGNANLGALFEPLAARVTAGFFIARADSAVAAGNNLPVGMDNPLENYSPQAALNIREPWIWRRTWILGDQGRAPGVAAGIDPGTWPTNNASYGSVADGPHIDARTARRVRKEERLWFAVSTQKVADAITGDDTDNLQGQVSWWLDYRVLGALRKSVARGSF